MSREITISLFRVAPNWIGLRGRREYSRRLRIIHYVIISPGNWIEVTTNRTRACTRTYTHARIYIYARRDRVRPRRETNRLFVDRRMTNCFGIRFLRELCSRVLVPSPFFASPSSSLRYRMSAEVIPLLKRFHPPYISICIRLKRFICHRGVAVYFHTDVPTALSICLGLRGLRGHRKFPFAKLNL